MKHEHDECGATFFDAQDGPVCCVLSMNHGGWHYARGLTWMSNTPLDMPRHLHYRPTGTEGSTERRR